MTVDPICHSGNYADYSDQQLHEELAYWRHVIDKFGNVPEDGKSPLINYAHNLAHTIANFIQLRIAREEAERG